MRPLARPPQWRSTTERIRGLALPDRHGIQEVASWFEMPLLPGVPVTPIDLWDARQSDLVFGYASGHTDPEQILTTWDPKWRERYRSDFEVFRAGDGQLSIRLTDHQ